MKRNRIFKMLLCLPLIALIVAAAGYVTQALWNWLMPVIFGLHTITFWQALGLILLSKILFGGFHKHGPRRARERFGRRMRERFEAMTPEERDRFKAGMEARRCGWGRDPRPEPDAAQV